MFIDSKNKNEITGTVTGELFSKEKFINDLKKQELSSFEGSLGEYSDHIEVVDCHGETLRRFDNLMNYRIERANTDKFKLFNEKEVLNILNSISENEYIKIELNNSNIKEIFFFKKSKNNQWMYVNVLVEVL